jgi:RHS repeat-associated protein
MFKYKEINVIKWFYALFMSFVSGPLPLISPVAAADSDRSSLPAVAWSVPIRQTASDGYADLAWRTPSDPLHDFFRLTEQARDETRSIYVHGAALRIFRAAPGRYVFRLQACARDANSGPICGPASQMFTLVVSEEILEETADAAEARAAALVTGTGDTIIGGPDQMRPGLWQNPERAGHGWSFYWSNYLARPAGHELYGYYYDLVGLWYTFEAQSRFLDGPKSCQKGGKGGECSWAFGNYRPWSARLKLIREAAGNYVGGIYVTRGGREVQAGSARIFFAAGNDRATIDWRMDFKYQSLAAVEEIEHLAGASPGGAENITHLGGLWQAPEDSGYTVAADLGQVRESFQIVFEDDLGDPTWVQAVNEVPPAAETTPLCFYYVLNGYAPDTFGTVGEVSLGCEPASSASASNRNGGRAFSDFELAQFWADIELPAGSAGGGVTIGGSESPVLLEKQAGFHRIFLSQSLPGCEISSLQPVCPVTLSWFTDGDFPEATAFAFNQTTGLRQPIATSTEPAMMDVSCILSAPGTWTFELRAAPTVEAPLIARSDDLQVVGVAVVSPHGLKGDWLEAEARRYRVQWEYDLPQEIDRFELEETLPDSSTVLHGVPADAVGSAEFSYPEGPFGAFSYRVRACRDGDGAAACSAWTDPLPWFVAHDAAYPGIRRIWGENTANSGTLRQDQDYHHAMGYHFRPEVDGVVMELGGMFNGVKTVKLFERATGRLLAETAVEGNNSFSYTPIAPVAVTAATEYTVAVYLHDGGGSYYSSPWLPSTWSDVTVLASTFIDIRGDPDAIPVRNVDFPMYGQADIGFLSLDPSGNAAPNIVVPADRFNYRGDDVDMPIEVSDPDGDPVYCTVVGLPDGLAETAECQVSGTVTAAAGDYEVSILATDGLTAAAPVEFRWRVRVADGPANPETPPEPASRPDFTIDPISASTGATAGEFTVDPQGAARYRIALQMAPGSGGLVPDAALEYNHFAPNGIAGVGWTLQGLSAIERCPQTFEQDGSRATGTVRIVPEDRFCIDGQRLVVIEGAYGEDGAEYRKEIDDFARIISYGASGSGPHHFIVWFGDGSFAEYGNSEDSRLEARTGAEPATAMTWAVNRRQDATGNYIEYVYSESASGPLELTIDVVRYTGNVRAETEPYAELRFHYSEGREDVAPSFVGGVALGRQRLLQRIDSLARVGAGDADFQSLRSYFLEYGVDGFGRQVLESIRECSDALAEYCFEPTRFGWLKSENAIFGGGASLGELLPRNFRGLAVADVNGDGRPDLLPIEEQRNRFQLSVLHALADGSFRSEGRSYSIPDNGDRNRPVGLLTIDIDADGYQDLLYPRSIDGSVVWVLRRSDGMGLGEEQIAAPDCCGQDDPNVARVLDFDGDGLADLLSSRADPEQPGRMDLVVLRNLGRESGSNPFDAPQAITVQYSSALFPAGPTLGEWQRDYDAPVFREILARSPDGAIPFDYDGDGRVDLLARVSQSYRKCDGDCPPYAEIPGGDDSSSELDFAGTDGSKPDGITTARVSFYLLFESDGESHFTQSRVLAVGAGLDCSVAAACDPWSQLPAAERMVSVDVNADGLPDLAFIDAAQDWYYRLNTGDGFSEPQLIALSPGQSAAEHGRFTDLNGDGFPDFIYASRDGDGAANWMVLTNDLGRGFAAPVDSGIRHGNTEEGDASLLLDFNGDSMLDNLFLDLRKGYVDSTTTRLYTGRNLITGNAREAINAIDTITTATGMRTELEYRPLTDRAVYTRMHDAPAAAWGRGSAVIDLVAPVYVVHAVTTSSPGFDDAEATRRIEHHYAGAKLQAGGRGFLGFAETVSWDGYQGLRTNTRFRQDFPLQGLPAEVTLAVVDPTERFSLLGDTESLAPPNWDSAGEHLPALSSEAGGLLLSYRLFHWQAQKSAVGSAAWWPYVAESQEYSYTLGGNLHTRTEKQHSYVEFGRLTDSVSRTWSASESEPFVTITTRNQYDPPLTASWILSRLARTELVHERANGEPISRKSAFVHDETTGLLLSETQEPEDPHIEVVTAYTLDLFGNRVRTEVRGVGMEVRSSRVEYDSLGRWPVRQFNHFGQSTMEVLKWDASGNALKRADIDGVITEAAADPMGRLFIEWTATGAWARTLLRPGAGAHCPVSSTYHTIVDAGGAPSRQQCFDRMGRRIREATQGFDGRFVYRDAEYDQKGRVSAISEPYLVGDVRHWTKTEFDVLGRPVRVQAADGNDFVYAYAEDIAGRCGVNSLNAVLRVNGLSQARVEVHSPLGELVEVFDDLCGRIQFAYDAVGNLVRVTDADGATAEMHYDVAGRKIEMRDTAKGHWRYRWNALGELERQLDGKAQAIDFKYDALGRVTERWEFRDVDGLMDLNGTPVAQQATAWRNSTQPGIAGKGRPESVIYRDAQTGLTVQELTFGYDAFGRREATTVTQGGMRFSLGSTFDEYGRPFQEFDASGDSRGIRFVYNSFGHVSAIKESREGAEGLVYQLILARDARGNATYSTLGNGVEVFADYNPASGRPLRLAAYDAFGVELQEIDYRFDARGNLRQAVDRSDGRDRTEDFDYDALNRLVRVSLTDPALGPTSPAETLALRYGPAGDIRWKSDVGDFTYGEGAAGPHALSRAGDRTFAYDANGNQIAGGERVVEYSVTDQPVFIGDPQASTRFELGVGNFRIRRIDDNEQIGQQITHYIGDSEYIETPESSRFRRNVGGIAVAEYFPATDAISVKYLVKDHLGSIHNLTDESGSIESATWLSFDAFGQRRDPGNGGPLSTAAALQLGALSGLGFTGHEQMDDFGLIHMGGRLYDPMVGRFLQADPFVGAPTESQGLNRYSYAYNSPLSHIDPSGYFSLSRFIRKWGRVAVAAAAAWFTYGASWAWSASAVASGAAGSSAFAQFVGAVGWQTLTGAMAGASSGFVAGAILSGRLRGAVKGAFAGAVTGLIGGYNGNEYTLGRVATETAGGGVSARILGGDFEDGLRFALIVSGLNYANYRMDLSERHNSAQNPDNLNKPGSGLYGHRYSIAGARRVVDPQSGVGSYLTCRSPAGGCQGLPIAGTNDQVSNLLGFAYEEQGMLGYLVDSFAGPHDWFRNHISRSYIQTANPALFHVVGNGKYFSGFRAIIDHIANFALIPAAAPFSVAAFVATQPYISATALQRVHGYWND